MTRGITARLASFIEIMRQDLAQHRESVGILLPGGAPPKPRARLAKQGTWPVRSMPPPTSNRGWSGSYDGSVAKAMTPFAKKSGGFVAAADLRRQKATWEPLVGRYGDGTLYNTSPGSQADTRTDSTSLTRIQRQ